MQWHASRATAAFAKLDWPSAAYHLQKRVELQPNKASLLWQLASLQFYLDDKDAYMKTQSKLFGMFRDSPSTVPLPNVYTVLCLEPEAQDDLRSIFEMVSHAVDQQPNSCTWLHVHGALAYRLGKFDDCLRSLDRAKAVHPGQPLVQDLLFRCMAYWQTDLAMEATALLEECQKAIEVQRKALLQMPDELWQYVVSESLFREARHLQAKTDAPIAPSNQAAN